MKNALHTLSACLAFALLVPVSATATVSSPSSAQPTPPAESAAEAVALPDATLEAVAGAVNWGKIGCWTGVVVVAVGAGVAGSPGLGAVASGALAVACLVRY